MSDANEHQAHHSQIEERQGIHQYHSRGESHETTESYYTQGKKKQYLRAYHHYKGNLTRQLLEAHQLEMQQQQVEGQTIQVQQVQIAHDGSDQIHTQGSSVASSNATMIPTSTMVMATPQQTMLSQQAMQNLQSPPIAPMPSQGGSTTITTMSTNPPQQMADWPGHGRVQVIQQPIQNPTYIQPVYNAQGQLIVPGNIALHPANMNQPIQVITAGKAFQPGQMPHMLATTQGKPIVQGQATSFPGYATIPTSGNNQTLVISPLSVLGQTNLLPQQQGKPQDMQKMIAKTNVNANALKTTPSPQQNVSIGNLVSSQPQGITTQGQTIIQPQIIGPIQYTCNTQQPRAVPQGAPQTMQFAPWQAAFGTTGIPQGLTWAPGAIQSSALLTQGSQIFIRNPQHEQPGMFIHNAQPSTIPQHSQMASQQINKPPQAVEMAGAPGNNKAGIPKAFSTILPNSITAQTLRPASSVSTQTGQTQTTSHQTTYPPFKAGTKLRTKNVCRMPSMSTSQKSDASNQTKAGGTVSALQPKIVVSHVQPGSTTALNVAGSQEKLMKQVPQQGTTQPQVQAQQQPLSQMEQMQSMFQQPVEQKPQSGQMMVSNGLQNANEQGVPMPAGSVAHDQMPNVVGNMIVQTVPGMQTMGSEVSLPAGQNVQNVPIAQELMQTSSNTAVDSPAKQEEGDQKDTSSQGNETTETGPGRPEPEENNYGDDSSTSNMLTESKAEKTNAASAEGEGAGPAKAKPDEEKEDDKKASEKDAALMGQPKAMVMVKPQVLTHVIEGFVIQESSEPFPVNRGCMDGLVRKMAVSEVLENGEPPKKKSLVDKEKDLAVCETCGKKDVKAKFKKSKRFCSLSCAKRGDEKVNGGDTDSGGENVPSAEQEGTETGEGLNNQDSKVNPTQWTVAEVCEFIRTLPGCSDYVEDFAMQDIDGEALMLLKPDHLMSVMSMKLGPAVKIIAKIDTMRGDGQPKADAPGQEAPSQDPVPPS